MLVKLDRDSSLFFFWAEEAEEYMQETQVHC